MDKNLPCLGRKGYFYSIDAFIAILIVSIGVFIILQSPVQEKSKINIYILSEDITNLLFQTKIYDINDEHYNTSLRQWKRNGTISRVDNTILQQAGEFYAKNQTAMAKYLLSNITASSVGPNYNFEVYIDAAPIYGAWTKQKSEAKSLISSKRIIAGQLDNKKFWGPYKAEVQVWQ